MRQLLDVGAQFLDALFSEYLFGLLDYVHFVVHVFSENARKFYDLERLWKSAKRLEPSALTSRKAGRTLRQKGSAPVDEAVGSVPARARRKKA